ncbi:phospholipase A1 VesT1.02 [Drosophila albomicans]|uniref:Phospholipase A1 VesT1.02 n=1 Tax=Drosophila albomicans TaxID=7291 RepID=A0A6P8XTC7_DROAB|nr:phospholipase A1 VesT1.02 [Drosophila albomicans]
MLLSMHSLLNILLIFLLRPAGFVAAQRVLAYEPGKCDVQISEVVLGLAKALFGRPVNVDQASLLQFDLYTPLNPQKRQILRAEDIKRLKKSNFNGKWPVRVLIHGWTGGSTTCYNAAVKDAYLSRGNYNVIILDWSRQAVDINYHRVSTQLESIAKSVAKLLRFLHDYSGVPYWNIYLVGHSAGSHIAGHTGKLLKPAQLGAIFALDPAGLTQLSLGPMERLAPTDATYVESIHTDLAFLGNPYGSRLSHAAFYANWGRGQPHCPNATATEFDIACDHFAAVYYFAESVRHPNIFGALRCNSQKDALSATCTCKSHNRKVLQCPADTFMGGEPAVPKKGIYYLSTRLQPPFGTADGLVHMYPPIKTKIYETRESRRNG